MTIAAVAAAAGWIAFLVLGPTVIGIIFPPSYADAIAPLTTLVPAVGLLGIYSILSGWMMGIGRPWTTALCLAAGACVTIAGQESRSTSAYGAVGAGIATGSARRPRSSWAASDLAEFLRVENLPTAIVDGD